MSEAEIARAVRAALEHTPRVNLHRSAVDVRIENGDVVLDGEVERIEEKRVAVECAKTTAGVRNVVDRLRVRPTTRSGDGAIRDAVCRHLTEEPAFQDLTISCRLEGDRDAIVRRLDPANGSIEASVKDGVVTLRGSVVSLAHKRLAGVLAWWAPGCRDVVNTTAIQPPEPDNDDEIREAIELVLNKDPIVHSDQVTSRVRDGRVVLRGVVATNEEKHMAETDVWYIEGVRDVVNELDVFRGPGRESMPASPPEFE
ncbi:MAG: BON domain-containing protein [Sulfurifustaceae bacterium]